MKPKETKVRIRAAVAGEKPEAVRLADGIAELAEPGFQERRSSALLADYLARRGFSVARPWKQMPAAFRATWGSGGPSIGLLAEYDALPDCGPKPGTWGHACGHNLLGVGAAVAAVAAARVLNRLRRGGRVTVWGCPAEELLAGKVYMARDGAFRGQDAILAWHPGARNNVGRCGGSAMDSLVFEFFGRTAHGAYAHTGRSALDGVMLLDVAANYLREHVPENVRIHMCVRDGGQAPNVVPAYAKSWYYVRGTDRAQVDDVRERLLACARGAAMATGTRVRMKRLTGCYNRLRNDVLADRLLANLKSFGAPRATAGDRRNAKRLGQKGVFFRGIDATEGAPGRASSDQDNVSWLAPFGGELGVACVSEGTQFHHRDCAAQMALPFAHTGMLRAAEVLAATAVDLCTDRRLLAKAGREFKRRRGRVRYDPLIPPHQKPPSAAP